jgi:hypothetical protein
MRQARDSPRGAADDEIGRGAARQGQHQGDPDHLGIISLLPAPVTPPTLDPMRGRLAAPAEVPVETRPSVSSLG